MMHIDLLLTTLTQFNMFKGSMVYVIISEVLIFQFIHPCSYAFPLIHVCVYLW